MHIENQVNEIIAEILDIDPKNMSRESYVIRELGAESIDLLELAVRLNDCFNVEIDEDVIFLKSLRLHLDNAERTGSDPSVYIREKYSFLQEERVGAVLSDLDDGPVLKVKDIVSYVVGQGAKN